MTRVEAESLIDWLAQKTSVVPYGEILIRVKVHAGRQDLIERTVTEKVKAGCTGGDHGNRSK